jgi:hypothetical protein
MGRGLATAKLVEDLATNRRGLRSWTEAEKRTMRIYFFIRSLMWGGAGVGWVV